MRKFRLPDGSTIETEQGGGTLLDPTCNLGVTEICPNRAERDEAVAKREGMSLEELRDWRRENPRMAP